jgi:hypothetical protein
MLSEAYKAPVKVGNQVVRILQSGMDAQDRAGRREG